MSGQYLSTKGEGFTVQCDQIDEFTGEKEYVMNWDSK